MLTKETLLPVGPHPNVKSALLNYSETKNNYSVSKVPLEVSPQITNYQFSSILKSFIKRILVILQQFLSGDPTNGL